MDINLESLSSVELILFLTIPILYSLMLTVEFIASFSRVAGYVLQKNAISYTLQNSVMATTRFFSMALLPSIGFLIDHGISKSLYLVIVLSSFLITSFGAFVVFLFRFRIITFFYNLILNYSSSGRLLYSVFLSLKNTESQEDVSKFCRISGIKFHRSITINTLIIYTVHSLGVFLTFFLALMFPSNQVMITQTTGVMNALGTLLLTLKLEPMISISIENRKDYKELFYNVFIVRMVIFLLISPIIFSTIYFFNF
ncbi:hypothetical protein [Shewanella chilikensis]|uniref:hypothetical protein n=1 Tax=Shewanella chilikensis TaxID=558541 RepID=UPI003005E910